MGRCVVARIRQARLSDLFAKMRDTAAITGSDRAIDLGRGVRLVVRVRNGRTVVSLARPRIPISPSEETTFRVNCQFPKHAERWPDHGQRRVQHRGQIWFQVLFRWKESADA